MTVRGGVVERFMTPPRDVVMEAVVMSVQPPDGMIRIAPPPIPPAVGKTPSTTGGMPT